MVCNVPVLCQANGVGSHLGHGLVMIVSILLFNDTFVENCSNCTHSWLLLIFLLLTHISLTSFLWDIGKKISPRCDAAKGGVPSGAILFVDMIFIEK